MGSRRISSSGRCTECGQPVTALPTTILFEGQEIHLFNPVVCADCLELLCRKYSVECANCGGRIPPYSHVGVLKADRGETQFVHMTAACSSVGSAFHGYWGRGHLGTYFQVEAC